MRPCKRTGSVSSRDELSVCRARESEGGVEAGGNDSEKCNKGAEKSSDCFFYLVFERKLCGGGDVYFRSAKTRHGGEILIFIFHARRYFRSIKQSQKKSSSFFRVCRGT